MFKSVDKKRACAQGWAFETVKGYELKRMSKKSVRVQTRSDCMQLCLNEQQFDCRSANFDSDINICWLSDMDRHTINVNEDSKTQNFGPSSGSVDYIENNCIPGLPYIKAKSLRTINYNLFLFE